MTNCNFTNNQATGNGGAICFDSTGNDNVSNCNFINCSAELGKAIYANDNTLISYCNFETQGSESLSELVVGGIISNCTINEKSNSKTFTDLNNLIQNAESELILTDDYIYSEGDSDYITISKNGFIIDGNGHTINAMSKSRIFFITAENVVLKNINFINGHQEEYGEYTQGGAIHSNGKNNTILNCNFTNNTANYCGAVYFNYDGEVINCNLILMFIIFQKKRLNYLNFIEVDAIQLKGSLCSSLNFSKCFHNLRNE